MSGGLSTGSSVKARPRAAVPVDPVPLKNATAGLPESPLMTSSGFAMRLEVRGVGVPQAGNLQLCNNIDLGVAPRSSLVKRERADQHCRAMQLCVCGNR